MEKLNLSSLPHSPLLGSTEHHFEKIDLTINSPIAIQSNWKEMLDECSSNKIVYYGGYLEERFFYTNKTLFGEGSTARCIHLGTDVWVPPGTSIHAPLNGKIHSMAYNDKKLDYGYTILLEHQIGSNKIYSLYGHLNQWHVSRLVPSSFIPAGEKLCEVGDYPDNGGWPPHLHFQLIYDLEGCEGDYVGVCAKDELSFYSANCPNGTSFLF